MKKQTTAVLALGSMLSTTSTVAFAANKPAMEKCFGVALKGKNDCKAGAGNNFLNRLNSQGLRGQFATGLVLGVVWSP